MYKKRKCFNAASQKLHEANEPEDYIILYNIPYISMEEKMFVSKLSSSSSLSLSSSSSSSRNRHHRLLSRSPTEICVNIINGIRVSWMREQKIKQIDLSGYFGVSDGFELNWVVRQVVWGLVYGRLFFPSFWEGFFLLLLLLLVLLYWVSRNVIHRNGQQYKGYLILCIYGFAIIIQVLDFFLLFLFLFGTGYSFYFLN